MNERTDVLALQATDSKGGLDRHKFAELIVRECFELVRFNSNGAGQEILEHFGVAE